MQSDAFFSEDNPLGERPYRHDLHPFVLLFQGETP